MVLGRLIDKLRGRNEFARDEPLPTVDDATAEGVAMAKQAAVMALKNRILVSAHTAPEDFKVEDFMDIARDIAEGLACESDDAAARTRDDVKKAEVLRGRGIHQHDYRRMDLDNLELREKSFEAVAARLREVKNDDERMRELVIRARDQAWAELAREMERSLDRTALLEHGDANYEAERDERLREFVTLDLFKLQMQSQREQYAKNHADETANDY